MKITVQHILVSYGYEIADLKRKLSEGVSFEDLARDFSKCPSGKNGGYLEEFGKGVMVPSFEKAAFALMPGEISAMVRTDFGLHLIKRVK